MLSKLKTFLSKKLLIAVFTAILLAVNNQLSNPLDAESVKNIVTVVVAYLLGQSAVDLVGTLKQPKDAELPK